MEGSYDNMGVYQDKYSSLERKDNILIWQVGLKDADSYFYQTNTALYPVKSENSPTTEDDSRR